MQPSNTSEILLCDDATEWESWLREHHDTSKDVWLLIAKRGSDCTSVTIDDALDVALCYGWIDSNRNRHNADYYLQRYSPRRRRSHWSDPNVKRVEALIRQERMTDAGMRAIEAGERDGMLRWSEQRSGEGDLEASVLEHG